MRSLPGSDSVPVLLPSPVRGLLIGLRHVVLVLRVVSLAIRGDRVAEVGVGRPVVALVVVGD